MMHSHCPSKVKPESKTQVPRISPGNSWARFSPSVISNEAEILLCCIFFLRSNIEAEYILKHQKNIIFNIPGNT
jgi:hypothetical protein